MSAGVVIAAVYLSSFGVDGRDGTATLVRDMEMKWLLLKLKILIVTFGKPLNFGKTLKKILIL